MAERHDEAIRQVERELPDLPEDERAAVASFAASLLLRACGDDSQEARTELSVAGLVNRLREKGHLSEQEQV